MGDKYPELSDFIIAVGKGKVNLPDPELPHESLEKPKVTGMFERIDSYSAEQISYR